MSTASAEPLTTALNIYIDTPTAKNRDDLLSAADAYRESWIITQASPAAILSKKASRRQPTTSYDRHIEVERVVSGIPVTLALQERTSASVGSPWWVLSWRTKYSAEGSNRRFYMANNSCWSIPLGVALDMIHEMEGLGGLNTDYFDWRLTEKPTIKVSSEMKPQEKTEAFHQITGPNEDWGSDPFFVISSDPNKDWKKLLIVNQDTNMVTFRSVTTNPDYMPKKALRPGEGWWLDNSMMDAGAQQMRGLYYKLKEYAHR